MTVKRICIGLAGLIYGFSMYLQIVALPHYLLFGCFFCSDDEVAHAASETIKSLARFPDAMVCV